MIAYYCLACRSGLMISENNNRGGHEEIVDDQVEMELLRNTEDREANEGTEEMV